MTPEEIAMGIFCEEGFEGWDDLRANIAQAIRDAYERAAVVAESTAGGHYMARAAASAIRALKG